MGHIYSDDEKLNNLILKAANQFLGLARTEITVKANSTAKDYTNAFPCTW